MQNPRKNSRASEFFPLIETWKQSNLSQKAFCSCKTISLHLFRYWYRKYRLQNGEVMERFIPLRIEPEKALEGSRFEIHYPNGVKIVLNASADEGLLKTLINAL